jgi:hypothetical protein
MLKLTYTKAGLHMERVAAPLEALVVQRVILAIRAGQTLHVEPGRASFLLSADAVSLTQLELAIQMQPNTCISVQPVDNEYVEISVQGSWLAETLVAHEGMFLTALDDRAEFFVYKLWQATQSHVVMG